MDILDKKQRRKLRNDSKVDCKLNLLWILGINKMSLNKKMKKVISILVQLLHQLWDNNLQEGRKKMQLNKKQFSYRNRILMDTNVRMVLKSK